MRRRQGFTLVELLVAVALIVFIMAILSEAFVAASKTFRDLKAAGDMADQLRSATIIMRRYLAADHFEGGRHLSDPNFWAAGPPKEGFFRVWHGTATGQPPNVQEDPAPAPDLVGTTAAHSYRSVNHALHFTVRLHGTDRGDFFSAAVPLTATQLLNLGLPESRYQDSPGTYNAQIAEVAFFLRAIIDPSTSLPAMTSPTATNPNGVPLYGLYMRQLLTASDNTASGGQVQVPNATPATFPEISGTYVGTNLFCNSPRDLTEPPRRFGMNPLGMLTVTDLGGFLSYPRLQDQVATPGLKGSDLLLTNVISFDVRLLASNATTQDFLGMHQLGQQFNNANASFNPNNPNYLKLPMVFDTWSSVKDDVYDYSGWKTSGTVSSIPMWTGGNTGTGPSIQAIQITLRIWNEKAEQTRQVTIEVPL
jgi:prepilin-type N-terminal cleavage/methylation domain-containing protein